MRFFCLFILSFLTLETSAQIHNPEFKEMLDSLYKHSVPLISVQEFKSMDHHNLYILDSREFKEFEVSHLKNARHVGYFWFDMRNVYDIPKDANIVVYCSVGYRSEKIGEKLIKYGFKNVYNLYGSIFEWVNEGNPVYKSSGVQTSEVHTYDKNWSKWVERGTRVY